MGRHGKCFVWSSRLSRFTQQRQSRHKSATFQRTADSCLPCLLHLNEAFDRGEGSLPQWSTVHSRKVLPSTAEALREFDVQTTQNKQDQAKVKKRTPQKTHCYGLTHRSCRWTSRMHLLLKWKSLGCHKSWKLIVAQASRGVPSDVTLTPWVQDECWRCRCFLMPQGQLTPCPISL